MKTHEMRRILADLPRAVISTRPAPIAQAFSALVARDVAEIVRQGQACLELITADDFATWRAEGVEPVQQLTMEVFLVGIVAVLEIKPAAVESALVDTIELWIEANAPAVASANIRLLEAALPDEEPVAAHRSLIELHQHVDFAACVQEQQAALQAAWADLLIRIDEALPSLQEGA